MFPDILVKSISRLIDEQPTYEQSKKLFTTFISNQNLGDIRQMNFIDGMLGTTTIIIKMHDKNLHQQIAK